MAINFQLTPKGLTEPSTLQAVDAAICDHLGVETDSERWYADWYGFVGLALAFGKSWGEIREEVSFDSDLIAVCNFLEANYEVRCWRV